MQFVEVNTMATYNDSKDNMPNVKKDSGNKEETVTCPECGCEFVPGQDMHPMERMRKQTQEFGKKMMMSEPQEEVEDSDKDQM